MKSVFLLIFMAALVGAPGVSRAQDISAFDVFSNVVGLIGAQAAQKSWSRIDRATRDCVDSELSGSGTRLAVLEANGIGPADPRLAPILADCAKTDAPQRAAITSPDNAQILDQIENAFASGAATTSGASQEVKESLLDLRQRAAAVDTRSIRVKAVATALLQDIDDALAQGATPTVIARLNQRLTNLTLDATNEDAWAVAAGKLTALQSQLEAIQPDLLIRDFQPRRDLLESALDQALAAPRRSTRAVPQYTLEDGDCADTSNPIGLLICEDTDTRWTVLDYSRAYYVARRLFPEQQQDLSDASVAFQKRAIASCKVNSALKGTGVAKALSCISSEFSQQRARLARLVGKTGPASEELSRPIAEHMQLQGDLKTAGYLPDDSPVDGVYGGQTRSAIEELQRASGLPVDGLMSVAVAKALAKSIAENVTHDRAALAALQGLVQDCESLLSDIEASRQEEQARLASASLRADHVARAKRLLAGPISETLRSFLLSYIDQTPDTAQDAATLSRMEQEYSTKLDEFARAERLIALVSDKSRVLVSGEGGYVILYNASPQAPSVAKSLSGDLVFDPEHTQACEILSSDLDLFVGSVLRQRLAAIGSDLRLPMNSCDPGDLKRYDLLVVERNELDPEILFPVLSSINEGAFVEASDLTGRAIADAREARTARIALVRDDIENMTVPGFGFLGLENDSPNICAITPAGLDAHTAILDTNAEEIQDELGTIPSYGSFSADNAFIAAKRLKCGAVYGSGADLSVLVKAFKRDAVAFNVWPLWFDDRAISKSSEDAVRRKTLEAERQGDKARAIADQKLLAEAKDAERGALRDKQELALRKQYGSMAKAFELRLSSSIDALLMNEPNAGDFAAHHPLVAGPLRSLLADKWEVISRQTDIADYGTAEFKGRTLELGIAKTGVKLRNRILGEYKDLCFITAVVDDAEFGVEREPLGIACDDNTGALETYKREERFSSRWVVE